MSVAALNVRIGAEIKGLKDGIRQSERELKRAGQTLGAAGNALSLALTVPLLGIGAAAIKTAGEMEALKKGMIATFAGSGRSAEAATAEVDALRKAAEAPGLDFEQAVKASLRLQGVGFSAEKARNTIVQLANAIASTGGTAENLNGVTVQFAQMISKGTILNSDLNVIKENMPGLAKLMDQAFGTTQAEKLRELGVTGKEFVEKITAEMAKMPRVQGGISNAIVNAGTAIKMFLADVGDSLNRTFNITGKLEGFSTWLGDLGKSFSELDEHTKRAVLGIGLFAISLGPALKATNLVIQGFGAMGNLISTVQIQLKTFSTAAEIAGGGIKGLRAGWLALDTAMKLSIIGAIVAAVIALGVAAYATTGKLSAAAQAQEAVSTATKTAADNIAQEKSKTDLLIATLNNANASHAERVAALNELKKISPEYFGKLDMENEKVNGLTVAYDAYIDSLMRAAKAEAARQMIVDLEKKRNAIPEDAKSSTMQTVGNFVMSGLKAGKGNSFRERQAQTEVDNAKELNAAIDAQVKSLQELVVANEKVTATTKPKTDATVTNTAAVKEANKQHKIYAEALSDVNKELSKVALLGGNANGQISAISSGIDKLLDAGFDEKSKEVQKFLGLLAEVRAKQGSVQPLAPKFEGPLGSKAENPYSGKMEYTGELASSTAASNTDAVNDKLVSGLTVATGEMEKFVSTSELVDAALDNMRTKTGSLGEGFAAVAQSLTESGNTMQLAAVTATMAMTQYVDQGGASFKELGMSAVGATAKVVRSYLQQAIAAMIAKSAFTSANPLLGLILGGIAGAGVGVLFNKLVGGLGVKGFASGTLSAPGGLAMVGEMGPELMNVPRGSQIHPAGQTSAMLRAAMGNRSSDTVIIPNVRVQGSDLVIVFDRAQKQTGRASGR